MFHTSVPWWLATPLSRKEQCAASDILDSLYYVKLKMIKTVINQCLNGLFHTSPWRNPRQRPFDLDRQIDLDLARQFKQGLNDFARQSKITRLKFLEQGTDAVYVPLISGRNQNAGQAGQRKPVRPCMSTAGQVIHEYQAGTGMTHRE